MQEMGQAAFERAGSENQPVPLYTQREIKLTRHLKKVYIFIMNWTVKIHRKAEKQVASLSRKVAEKLQFLIADIILNGPVRGTWPNYSNLPDNRHHCHLKKGNPTYVAVWKEDKQIVTVEIIYVGTHENAPY
jgi:mRNA-degrading endonuclease RelE of RelBE toxin-antitoxin system